MKKIKIFAVMAAVSWISLIVLSIIGNILEKSGLFPNLAESANFVPAVKIVFFSLFLLTAFSIAPLFVKFFIMLATRLLPENLFLKKLEIYEFQIVCALWLIWLSGLIIALPVMIAECFFCSK